MLRILSILLMLSHLATGQLPGAGRLIQVSGGTSFNGTGDISGFSYNVEYGQHFKKKLSWYAGLGGTIHDKSEPIFYTDPSGNSVDGSVRATIAGFHVTGLMGYSIIENDTHDFFVRLGALIRYQSSSYWDMLAVLPPAGTGLPIPVVAFINSSRQRTVAIGATPQIGYTYSLSRKYAIGILASFQFDSNGDVLRNLHLTLGRRF